jgi:hypothetical protein
VLATPHLTPLALFLGVKLTEILFHLRPRALKRLLISSDWRYLKIMRASMWIGLKVILAELYEFFFHTRFAPQGSISVLPGSQSTAQLIELNESELAGRALQTDQTL